MGLLPILVLSVFVGSASFPGVGACGAFGAPDSGLQLVGGESPSWPSSTDRVEEAWDDDDETPGKCGMLPPLSSSGRASEPDGTAGSIGCEAGLVGAARGARCSLFLVCGRLIC